MATFRGNLYVAQPTKNSGSSATADNECAFIFSDPNGLRGGNTVTITEVLFLYGITECLVQFTVSVTASNLTQKNWRTNSDGGTAGVAGGCFELSFNGKSYLCFPKYVAGYYTGSAANEIKVFCHCAYPRTAAT